MKKILFFSLPIYLCLSFLACTAQESIQDSKSEVVSEVVSEIVEISETASDSETSYDTESYTTESSFSSSESDVISEISTPIFDGLEDFKAEYSSTFSKIIDPAKLSPAIAVKQITPHKTYYDLNYYGFGSSTGILSVYPLSSNEQDLEPWEVFVKRWGVDTIRLCSSPEEFNNQNLTNAYKYTKEGVDMYLVRSVGGSSYSICFKIEDHIFIASSILSYNLVIDRLPSIEEYEKFKPLYEQEPGFYELSDLSDDKSELVRLLKECVSELGQDDTVTE